MPTTGAVVVVVVVDEPSCPIVSLRATCCSAGS